MDVLRALGQNVILLIAMLAIYFVIIKYSGKNTVSYKLLSGVLFGFLALIAMTMPYTFKPGIIFDARSIIHNVAGWFGGPFVALIAALISSSFRYYLGGAGMLVGISTIIQASLFGVLFHYLTKYKKISINILTMLLLSVITNVVMLAMFTAIPDLTVQTVVSQLALPIMILYPSTTVILASLLLKLEKNFQNQKALQESEAVKSSIISAVPDLLIKFDKYGTYVDILTKDESKLARPRNELLGRKIADILPADLANETLEHIRKVIKDKVPITYSYSMITNSGYRDFEARFASDDFNNVIAHIRDVTDLKQFKDKIEYYTIHDSLTGLYTRTYFEESLKHIHKNNEYPISIICADIDGLNLVNDAMGHGKGDELLLVFKDVFQHAIRKKDILARIDGDEYAAILPSTDPESAEFICDRILDRVAKHNSYHGNFPLTMSLGFATAFAPGKETPLNLLKRAEDSMYQYKTSQKHSKSNRVVQALIAALAERDFITDGHADRIQKLCVSLGEKIGLSGKRLSDIELLARVHDLGKVGIPDSILFKTSRLAIEEWEIMKSHPEKGSRIASASIDLAAIAPLILKHHEHWDGNGYPLQLKGEEIPVECRILSIVDAYDAMTHDRPYCKARTKEEAITELKNCAGRQFDPNLVKIFVSIVEKDGL